MRDKWRFGKYVRKSKQSCERQYAQQKTVRKKTHNNHLFYLSGYFQEVQAEDGRSFQIEAPNLVIQQHQEEVNIDEEEVDENYDPTFFLQNLQPTPAAQPSTSGASGTPGPGGDSTTIGKKHALKNMTTLFDQRGSYTKLPRRS